MKRSMRWSLARSISASTSPRAERETLSLQRTLGLTRNVPRSCSESEIGVSTEREPEGDQVTGPEISVPLPIFDFGQARVAAARHRLAESQHRAEALASRRASEVRLAYVGHDDGATTFEQYRDRVLPLRQRIVEQAQLHYNAMLLGVFELLQGEAE
jgi:hypothetical protein